VSLKAAVVALMLLSLVGCTSMQPIEDFSPSRIRAQVEEGDEVHIVTRKGSIYDLTVTRVTGDAVEGRTGSGKRYKVAFEAIEYIEVQRTDLIRSAGTMLTTFYVTAAVIVTTAIIAWSVEDD
jgi:hypothetical protein